MNRDREDAIKRLRQAAEEAAGAVQEALGEALWYETLAQMEQDRLNELNRLLEKAIAGDPAAIAEAIGRGFIE